MPDADVLVLEDEGGVADLVAETLEAHGLGVTVTTSCSQFQALSDRQAFDVYLLDVALPDGSGLDIARSIRSRDPRAGIIMLSARSAEIDMVLGLELGADDYVPKPFRGRELLARVRSLLRRMRTSAERTEADQKRFVPLFGGWTMDLAFQKVQRDDGQDAGLTATEFRTLQILRDHSGVPLSRGRLVELLRGKGWEANDRLIDGVVSRLRRKLGPEGNGSIRTVKKLGYVYEVEPATDRDRPSRRWPEDAQDR